MPVLPSLEATQTRKAVRLTGWDNATIRMDSIAASMCTLETAYIQPKYFHYEYHNDVLSTKMVNGNKVFAQQFNLKPYKEFARYHTISAKTYAQYITNAAVTTWNDCGTAATADSWITSAAGSIQCNVKWRVYTDWVTNAITGECVITNGLVDGNSITFHKPLSAIDRLKQIILARRAPAIRRRTPAAHTSDLRELRARQTLRLVVGDERYRRFLRDGFVTARNSQSGRVYQIYPGYGKVHVYEHGKLTERLCVHLTHGFTDSDHTIVRFLMCLNNEARLWALANKHGVGSGNLWGSTVSDAMAQVARRKVLTLPELYRNLKQAA